MPALTSALMRMPESTSPAVPRCPQARVMSSAAASAHSPPANAPAASPVPPKQTIITAAPSVAPPETPTTSGAASGFPSSA